MRAVIYEIVYWMNLDKRTEDFGCCCFELPTLPDVDFHELHRSVVYVCFCFYFCVGVCEMRGGLGGRLEKKRSTFSAFVSL